MEHTTMTDPAAPTAKELAEQFHDRWCMVPYHDCQIDKLCELYTDALAKIHAAEQAAADKALTDLASDAGVATGHGDTLEELRTEIIAGIKQAAARTAREECAQLAEKLRHPLRGLDVGAMPREKFYQTHIREAWTQAGYELARRIRALAEKEG